MKALHWFVRPEHRLDVVAGVSDGMLTALTLAGGKMIGGSFGISLVTTMLARQSQRHQD